MTSIGINDPGRSLCVRRDAAGQPSFDQTRELEVMERRVPRQPGDASAASVGDIMTRNVRSCRPEDTLAAAVMAMCEADCRFLPVVDSTSRPVGVVTDGDICLLGTTSHRRLSDMFVRDAMSGPPATCHAGDPILDALQVIRQRRIRHLPVVGRQGILEGVVSLTDIVLFAAEEDSPPLRREIAVALREMVQKHGDQRVIEIERNPFVED